MTGGFSTGGLVGINRGIVEDSYAEGIINADVSFVGGLAGENRGEIRRSYATGLVDANLRTDVSGAITGVGGFVGQNTDEGLIENCYSRGGASMSGIQQDYVGAFVGENVQNSEIRNSYASGSASAAFGDAGGVAGLNEASAVDVYYNSDLNDDNFGEIDGGSGVTQGLTTDEMQGASAEDNMSALAFGTIWATVTEPEDDYPVLVGEDGIDDDTPDDITRRRDLGRGDFEEPPSGNPSRDWGREEEEENDDRRGERRDRGR